MSAAACGWMMGGQETIFPLRSNSQLNYNYGSYRSYSYSTFTDQPHQQSLTYRTIYVPK
jgi:hypothetical protein